MSRLPRARAAAALLVLVAMSGCSLDNLQVRNDDRLSFRSPEARHRVTAPVTVSWDMKDFEATGLDGSTDKSRGAFIGSRVHEMAAVANKLAKAAKALRRLVIMDSKAAWKGDRAGLIAN